MRSRWPLSFSAHVGKSAALLGTSLLVAALGTQASARSSVCIQDGEIVTFDGVASAHAPVPDASRSAWVLNLPRPICVLRSVPFAPGAIHEEVSAIRIIGTPPPLGVPLALTGKLLLGRAASDATMFVALEVIHGRKIPAPYSTALPGSVPPLLATPRQRALPRPVQMAAERCNAAPYGGTQANYQAFVRRFGHIINPPKILAGICNAKFGRSPRDGLHKLGFSDAKIDSESTEQLAEETIRALKNLVNTIE